MAKSKEKHDSKKDKPKRAAIGAQSDTAAAATTGYTDGTPLDRVQYLEAKLILKPDRFDFGAELPRFRQDRAAYSEEAWCWFHRGP